LKLFKGTVWASVRGAADDEDGAGSPAFRQAPNTKIEQLRTIFMAKEWCVKLGDCQTTS